MKNNRKAIKKWIFVAGTLVICVFAVSTLSSCLSVLRLLSSDDWLTKDQKKITDVAIGRLCAAIERKEVSAIREEFSWDDVKDADDFDGEILELLRYVKGENLTFRRISSGSDGAAMGGYPREREFGGVRYDIATTTDNYKVIFGYRSHYSTGVGKISKEKIGFTHFDIINVKNDRDCEDRLYSGCPFYRKGINLNYKTNYIFCPEEYDYKTAFFENGRDFEPVILNSVEELEAFYRSKKEEFSLGSRRDGKGFQDIAAKYDEEFFETRSLYLVGIYHASGGYFYVPQFLYIGDFVLVNIVAFGYESGTEELQAEIHENGVIKFIELPEKVDNDIETILDLEHFESKVIECNEPTVSCLPLEGRVAQNDG